MRKEFEEFYWKENNHSFSDNLTKDMLFKIGIIEGNYFDNEVRVAFYWWKASREAMKPVKLPKLMKNTQEQACYYYNDAIAECKEAIQQAGYEVE